MIGHMRHGSPPRLMVLQSILSPNRGESLPTPSAGVRISVGLHTDPCLDHEWYFGLRLTPSDPKSSALYSVRWRQPVQWPNRAKPFGPDRLRHGSGFKE